MHPKREIIVYIFFCMIGFTLIHTPLVFYHINHPMRNFIDCSKYCLPMNSSQAGFQISLASLNIIFTSFLVTIVRRLGTNRTKSCIRTILVLKIFVMFFTGVCSFSADIAADPTKEFFWIFHFALVRGHFISEVVFSIFVVAIIVKQENNNTQKIRINMSDRLQSSSEPVFIYFAPPVGQEVIQPIAPLSPVIEELSEEERILNELGTFLTNVVRAHHERYPLVTFRPPIRFEDYE